MGAMRGMDQGNAGGEGKERRRGAAWGAPHAPPFSASLEGAAPFCGWVRTFLDRRKQTGKGFFRERVTKWG